MASNAGSLVVSLGLDAAQYVAGLTKSEYQAKKFADNVARGFGRVTTIVGAVAGAATVAAGAIARVADSVANYQGLAEKIGDTATAMSALQTASDRSGVALETVAGLSVKLSDTLAKTSDQSKGAGAALAAIGISLDEFKDATPVERLQLLADNITKFRNSSSKTAVAVALMGRSGAEALPFLNDLADTGSKNARASAEQIAQADALSKQFADLRGESSRLAQQFFLQGVPALLEIVGAMRKAYEESGLLKAAFIGLGGAAANVFGMTERQKIQARVQEIDKELDVARKQLEAKSLKPEGASKSFFSFLIPNVRLPESTLQTIRKTIADLEKERARLLEQQKPPAAPELPEINFDPGRDSAAADALKRRLELAKVAAESELALQKEVQNKQLAALDSYNAQGLVSTQQYYDLRRQAIAQGLQNELRLISTNIGLANQRLSQARQDKDFGAETTALAEIARLVGQRRQLQAAAAADTVLETMRQQAEEKRYGDQIAEVNAQILTLTGNTLLAAQARQRLANQDLRRRAVVNGDEGAQRQLRTLDELTIAQAEFQAQLERQSSITTRLSIEEERIQNSQRVGAISEIEALKRTGDARARSVQQLDAIVVNLERVAASSKNPALILQAEQARAALERLRGETDLLAQKFDTVFRDSFSTAFADFVSGSKTAKEAFNDFAKSVTKNITDLVAQDFAKAIFGGGKIGGGGSIGGILAGIFGGGGGAVSTDADAQPGGFYGVGGGGILGTVGGFLKGLIPGFAVGTPMVPRDMLAFVHKGERIVPANQNKPGAFGGMMVNMTINTPDAGSFRASRGQITAQIAAAMQAAKRNL